MKISIITAVWKRPEVFEIFAKSIHELQKIKGLEISVVACGSEGSKSRRMVQNHGFTYIEKPNNFISDKFNAAAKKCKIFAPDYVLILGSDDIFSPELMRFYKKQTKRKPDIVAVLDFYYYDMISKQSMYWSGYTGKRQGEPAGAGRMISARLMELLNWQPFDKGKKRGIDSVLWRKVNEIDHSRCTFKMRDFGLYAIDVKSSTNITPFIKWDNCSPFPSDVLTDKFVYLPK